MHVHNPKAKHQYAHMLCLFLAESLRTHRISLKRAGEITKKFLSNINLIDSEVHFLGLVKEMAKDFEELVYLENKVKKNQELNAKRSTEALVRDFSIQLLPRDPKTALHILERASMQHATLGELRKEFPLFDSYVQELNSPHVK